MGRWSGAASSQGVREVNLKAYIAGLLAFALALAGSWIYWEGVAFDPRLLVGALAFAGIILVGEAFPIRVSGQGTIGAWDIGLILAVATVGPT